MRSNDSHENSPCRRLRVRSDSLLIMMFKCIFARFGTPSRGDVREGLTLLGLLVRLDGPKAINADQQG